MTTVIHEARWSDTLCMLAQMADVTTGNDVERSRAESALAWLREMSADLRGAAILRDDGSPLAATGDLEAWADAGRELFAAADAAGAEAAERVHVATEDGEAFGIRGEGHAVVAVTSRFTLASLMLFDMRAVLRDMAA